MCAIFGGEQMNRTEAKKDLEYTRDLTKGTMPIIIEVSTQEEYDLYIEVKKTMRNVKNIEIELKED